MNEPTPCGEPCHDCPSAATCPTHNQQEGRVDLDVARARFEKEGIRGICDTGRYRMPFFSWGQGPPLLFIHGVSDRAESYLQLVSVLSRNFRCIVYDLPTGAGDGARLGRIRHRDLVADVWALLDHLHIDKSYVFGSSFGSTITLTAMHERPERLPRGVIQGGFAHRPLKRAEWMVARTARWMPGVMRKFPARDRILEARHSHAFRELPGKVWISFLQCTGRTPVRAFGHQLLMLNKVDLRPILPEIRQPIMIVVGDRDVVIGTDCEEVLQKGLPHAGKVILEGCGHLPVYTHPDMLAAVVRQFLTPPRE